MIAHIGYHKTGTTYLQHNVFPNMKGITFYNVNEYKNMFFKDQVCWATTLEFNAEYVKSEIDTSPDCVYSFENFVGFLGLGRYNYEIAHRLKEIGFKKIIVVIRRQDKMVESLYREHIQSGGTLKPKAFIEDVRYFRWGFLDYLPLLNLYAELFGKENLMILKQEELKKSEKETVAKIMEFCGATDISEREKTVRRNRSFSVLGIRLLRIINHFTYSNLRPSNLISNRISTWKVRQLFRYLDPLLISHFSFRKSFFKKDFFQTVMEKYRQSNIELDEEFNLGLKELGYYKD